VRARREIHDEQGQTAVEFALVAPLLVVLLLAILQLGVAFNSYVTLTDATRAGARKAILQRLNGSGGDITCLPSDTNTICQTVRAAAGSLDTTKLQVSSSSTDWDTPGSDVTVTATYPYTLSLLKWTGAWVGWSGTFTITSTAKERLE
jgi:Flp pilus assembly protein TadG